MKFADSTQPPVISDERKSERRYRFLWMIIAAVLVLAVVLFRFDPEQSNFYPHCAFKKATGWSCPACGCLRASHQILHGHIATAFRLNALFIIALPVAALLVVQQFLPKPIITKPAYFGWRLLILFVLFGVLRNLPPFLAWSAQ
jgi:hypothetical protein